jgi:hypothetical protein
MIEGIEHRFFAAGGKIKVKMMSKKLAKKLLDMPRMQDSPHQVSKIARPTCFRRRVRELQMASSASSPRVTLETAGRIKPCEE